MPPNINKKNYRLADMSLSPDDAVPYPDPDETAEVIEDRIDMAEFGTVLHVREWRGSDDTVEQFALMLNVTPEHEAYNRCRQLKGGMANFEQVRRTDTWHSTIMRCCIRLSTLSVGRPVNNERSEKTTLQRAYGGCATVSFVP